MIKKKKPVEYVNNKDLVKAIVDWQAQCKEARAAGKEPPIPSNYIGHCILKICNGLGNRYNFVSYTFKDEMIDDGIEKCVGAIKNFDVTKTNQAFNYLTMVAFKAFQYRIGIEKKQHAVKHKNFQYRYTLAEVNGLFHEEVNNEHSSRIIEEYESKFLNKESKKNVQQKQTTSNPPAIARSRRIPVKGKQG